MWGLGSGTQLGLAVAAAAARFMGLELEPAALGAMLERGARFGHRHRRVRARGRAARRRQGRRRRTAADHRSGRLPGNLAGAAAFRRQPGGAFGRKGAPGFSRARALPCGNGGAPLSSRGDGVPAGRGDGRLRGPRHRRSARSSATSAITSRMRRAAGSQARRWRRRWRSFKRTGSRAWGRAPGVRPGSPCARIRLRPIGRERPWRRRFTRLGAHGGLGAEPGGGDRGQVATAANNDGIASLPGLCP